MGSDSIYFQTRVYISLAIAKSIESDPIDPLRSTHRLEYTRPLRIRSLARAFLTNPGVAHNSVLYGRGKP
jgi:hypothetical protein